MEILKNPYKNKIQVKPFSAESSLFYSKYPSYCPSPVKFLPDLAAQLGLRMLCAKLETARFGLNSFKILGAKWALHQYLTVNSTQHIRHLITATDGNHGRAVARLARQEGLAATIYVPNHTSVSIIAQLISEGAEVIVVPGTYDDSVDAAHERAVSLGDEVLLLSDTSADISDNVAEWIIQGYETIFAELETQLAAVGGIEPDLVLVQIGVGGLAAAAARYFSSHKKFKTELIGVEAVGAEAAMRSIVANKLVRVEASSHTLMAGINAGLLSAVAWPDVKHGFDWFISIEDLWCHKALEALTLADVWSGPTGAAAIAGTLAIASLSQELILTGKSVFVIITEGLTVDNF